MYGYQIKTAFLSTVKHRISELEDEISVLSKEDLYQQIGLPDEIAKGFENRDDFEFLKRKARRYKIICTLCLAFALLAVAILIIVVISDNDYYITTNIW